jgi:hypothetical protein
LRRKKTLMRHDPIRPARRTRHRPVEPLLPVEKKLIAWSLSLGLTLFAVLAAIHHFFPVTL